MDWLCSTCGNPVDDGGMVGYFTDSNNSYISGSLGCWHNNADCGRKDEHDAGLRRPHDFEIRTFKANMSAVLATWEQEANTVEFRNDLSKFMSEHNINL